MEQGDAEKEEEENEGKQEEQEDKAEEDIGKSEEAEAAADSKGRLFGICFSSLLFDENMYTMYIFL